VQANQTPHSSARIAGGIAAIRTFALGRLRLLSLTHLGWTGSSIFFVATFFSLCLNHYTCRNKPSNGKPTPRFVPETPIIALKEAVPNGVRNSKASMQENNTDL
jgi:hypothetical protein